MYLNNPTKIPMGLTQEDWKHLIGVCYHYDPLKNYFYCLFSRDFIKNFPETIFAPGQIYRFRQQFENAKDFSEINFSLFKTILAKNNLNYIIKHFEVIFIMRLRDFFYGSLEDKIKEELMEGNKKEEEILSILYSLSLQTLGNAHRYRNKSLFNDCFHFDLNISFNSDKYHTLRNGYEKAFDFIRLAPKEKKKACAYYKEYIDHYYFSEMNKITSFYKDHKEKKKAKSRTYSYNPLTNYFQILGINPTASQNEFKKAYLSLAKRYHPDNKDSGDLKRMQEINTAFELLSKYYNA